MRIHILLIKRGLPQYFIPGITVSDNDLNDKYTLRIISKEPSGVAVRKAYTQTFFLGKSLRGNPLFPGDVGI